MSILNWRLISSPLSVARWLDCRDEDCQVLSKFVINMCLYQVWQICYNNWGSVLLTNTFNSLNFDLKKYPWDAPGTTLKCLELALAAEACCSDCLNDWDDSKSQWSYFDKTDLFHTTLSPGHLWLGCRRYLGKCYSFFLLKILMNTWTLTPNYTIDYPQGWLAFLFTDSSHTYTYHWLWRLIWGWGRGDRRCE